MSVLNSVLYGNRLYSKTTYSENYDPQTFNLMFNETITESDTLSDTVTKPLLDFLSLLDAYAAMLTLVKTDSMTLSDAKALSVMKPLSDSISPADASVIHFTKVLADTESLLESITISTNKPLTDSMTLSDAMTLVTSKFLSESVNSVDAPLILQITKDLTETILVQDWVSIRLMQPQGWIIALKPLVGYSSLYGQTLYGKQLYSGLSATVWTSIKPVISGHGWTNFNEGLNA